MALQRTTFLLFSLALCVSAQDPVPCQDCQQLYLEHYAARNCTPVFDDTVSLCCPASFNCSTGPAVVREDEGCPYRGKVYAVGETVPVTNPCDAGCYCRPGTDGQLPKVECAVVECPSLFNPRKPFCRNLYNSELCCEVGEECTTPELPVDKEPATATGAETTPAPEGTTTQAKPEANIRSTASCTAEDKEYKLGDKIYFTNESCQTCVCTENYTDAFGPNCTTIDCGMDYRYAQQLRDGCTPIYFRNRCCSIDWICPNSERVKPLADQPTESEATTGSHCKLGDIVVPRNASAPTDNCNLNCLCVTPPDLTCVQYPDCDEAAKALETRILQ
ncbi:kielin/chordin-like protein [Hyalella azteca]|uniref:Kielin/chordin-like protein n=1 Tax=Hyalella azteca TaxID=294128 RepID=A0A8B7PEI1_HYAAZ|nr:kielin/chordin-like protein [Hyalella azteca]